MDWQNLVDLHGSMIYCTCWRILGHAGDAEDAMQETLLQGFRQRDEVRNWPAFLRFIAVRVALQVLRKRRVIAPIDAVEPVDRRPMPDVAAEQKELIEQLLHAVAGLPSREAEVFSLRYFEGMSPREITEQLGMNYSAVNMAIHRARKRVESILESSDTEEHIHVER